MANRLRKLRVDFGSLVDKGAGEDVRVCLFKRDDTTPSDNTTAQESHSMKDTTKKADASAETKPTEATTAAPAQETKPATEAAAVTEPTEKKAPAGESVSKADYDALRERLEKAEAKATKADEIAKSERDQRITKEFIEKARGYDVLPIPADQLGPILKRAADNALTDADRTEIDRVLKAANELIKKGNAFGETGRTGAASEGSAWAQIEAAAADLQKADSKLTQEAAIAKVLKTRADLVKAHRAESH